jgi:hypothetical protein
MRKEYAARSKKPKQSQRVVKADPLLDKNRYVVDPEVLSYYGIKSREQLIAEASRTTKG